MCIAFGVNKHFMLFLVTSTKTFVGAKQECAMLEILRKTFILLAKYFTFYWIFKREGENQMLWLIELSQGPQENIVYSPGLRMRHFVIICLRPMNKDLETPGSYFFFNF